MSTPKLPDKTRGISLLQHFDIDPSVTLEWRIEDNRLRWDEIVLDEHGKALQVADGSRILRVEKSRKLTPADIEWINELLSFRTEAADELEKAGISTHDAEVIAEGVEVLVQSGVELNQAVTCLAGVFVFYGITARQTANLAAWITASHQATILCREMGVVGSVGHLSGASPKDVIVILWGLILTRQPEPGATLRRVLLTAVGQHD